MATKTINDDDLIHFLDCFRFNGFMSKKRPVSLPDWSQWWWSNQILTGSLLFAVMSGGTKDLEAAFAH